MSTSHPQHIYPHFERMLPRADKEKRLGQRGAVVWLYGLSGSGKSTLALALERRLFDEGFVVQILDGDNVRTGLNKDLGFSDADRKENIRRVAEVTKLFAQAGVVTLASFITPTEELRALAKGIVGAEDFLGVYVKCPFEKCAERDPKGLYAKARAGGVKQFTGKDSAFEEPVAPDLEIDTDALDLPAALERLYAALLPRVRA